MDIVLKVTPEQLISAADDISNQIKNVSTAFRNLESEIQKSAGYWEGDASNQHQKSFNNLKDDIEFILNTLKNRPDDLLKMANLYRETEQQNTAIAGSLSNNLIS